MRVLIAVEGDEESSEALAMAQRLLPDDAEKTVLRVAPHVAVTAAIPVIPIGAPVALTADEVLQAQTVLDEQAQATVEEASERVGGDPLVEHGPPATVICRVAEELRADLIVIGTHDRSAWTRFWSGSVTDYVTHHAPCSVLVVR